MSSQEYLNRPLHEADGPLVWIDCEMTGLDFKTDKLLEIAIIITDGDLTPIDDGCRYAIKMPKSVLDNMNRWCTDTHGNSGLTNECLESPHDHEWVAQRALSYIQRWIPTPRTGVLAGNSVHADRAFLTEHMPDLVNWLHYRIVDVSSVKELCKRWRPDLRVPKGESSHRALDDIHESIKELQWYREHFFQGGAGQQK